MAREYFCAYHSYLKSMRNLSEAECGRLFKALLMYSAGDKSINLQGRESVAFDFMTEQIDRDNEKYEEICAKNRRNAIERSVAVGSGRMRSVANGSQTSQRKGEGEGKGKGEKKKEAKERTFASVVVSEQLFKALTDFETMRNKIKKPLTERAKELLMGNLVKLSSDESTQIAILQQSITHCWQNVYALKNQPEPSNSFDVDKIEELLKGGIYD